MWCVYICMREYMCGVCVYVCVSMCMYLCMHECMCGVCVCVCVSCTGHCSRITH